MMTNQQMLIDWSKTTPKERQDFAEQLTNWQVLSMLHLRATAANSNRLIILLTSMSTVLLLTLASIDQSVIIVTIIGLQLLLFGISHWYESRVKTAASVAEVKFSNYTKTLSEKYPIC